jgi:hypothetical protein
MMLHEPSKRRDAGMLQVTERDTLTLTWIAEQYCLCFDQLRFLLAYYTPATVKDPSAVAISTARNTVERWLQMGYIEAPQKIIREHSTYIWLSRKGLKELGLTYSYYHPKPSTIRHLYAVNAIRLHLLRYQLSATWIAQRTLRTQSDHQHLPDAALHTHAFPLVAIQVLEPSFLAPITLQDELTTLSALIEHYTRIWLFLHEKAVKMVQEEIQAIDARDTTPDNQLADRLVWFRLDATQIAEQSAS